MATTTFIDLTGMTPSPSPPQRSSCRASSSAAASSYLKRRDANAPSPYSSSSSSARKVIVYVYSSDDESEQVPPSSQGSNSGGIAARSSSSGGCFLEPDGAVENEEEESILEFRSHLSRFAGPKAPPVKPAASSSSASRRSRSPTKAGPSRAAAGQKTARSSEAQDPKKRSASPSRPVEGKVASSSKTSPAKKRAKRTPKAAAAAAAAAETDATSDGATTSPTKKSAAKPKAPALPPPPPPLDLTPFPNSKLLLLTMCPLCSHPFPARQPAPTRRRHISLCGSAKSITASVALAVLDDEIRRLDRLAQIEEQEKQMHESCWDFLVRSSGLGVRRTQDEEMWDALGLPQGSARRTECRRREEEADALAGVELGVRNASAEALKSARRWKRLDEGSRVCLLEKHAQAGRKRAHRCFVELCDGLYGGDEDEEEEERDVFDTGFDEPGALADRPSSSMWPPATQSIRHRASRLAIRKGRGPNAGYGLGLHLAQRRSASGNGVER